MGDSRDLTDFQVDGHEAVFAHFMVRYTQFFSERIMSAHESIRSNLVAILTAFVCYNIQPYVGSIVSFGVTSNVNLNAPVKQALFRALAKLRPYAVTLVDAFEYDDSELVSALGSYDGNAYERLADCWHNSRYQREADKIVGHKQHVLPLAKL
jgi:acyl-CoA oxidase